MKQKYMPIRITLSFFAFLFFAAVLVTPHSVHALGISPPTITANAVLRDAAQTKQLEIIRGLNDTGQLTILVSVRGDADEYIILPEEEIIMPEGVNSLTYSFQILPDRLANGSYAAKIDFLIQPKTTAAEEEGTAAAMNVITGVTAPIYFTVTGEEIVEFDIFNLGVRDTEVSQPVYVTYSVTNSGNVSWRPDSVELTFTNIDDPSVSVTETVAAEDIDYIAPGIEAKQVAHELDLALEEGAYSLNAAFTYKNEVVEQLEVASFNVYPEGSLQQDGELRMLSTNKEAYSIGEKIKLDAIFENTGEVAVKGLLITELYKDDELVDIIRGKELVVDKGSRGTFTEIITADSAGTYTFTSYVEYGFKRTDSQSISFVVIGGLFSSTFFAFFALFALSTCILGAALLYRHHKLKAVVR